MSRTRAYTTSQFAALSKMDRSERLALARIQQREARQKERRNQMKENVKTVVVTVPQTIRGKEERKYVDGFLNLTSVHELLTTNDTWADCELNPSNAAGVIGCLPVPKQGDDLADRDGRKIVVKKVVVRGVINWGGADAVTSAGNMSPVVRIIVVKDKQTGGVELSAENVVGPGVGSDGAAAQTGGASIMSLSKPTGWGRYQIMKDKMYTRPLSLITQDGTDGALMECSTPFKFTLNLNTEINFSGTTGVVGSVIDNSFHLLAATSNNGASQPQISYLARTTFVG